MKSPKYILAACSILLAIIAIYLKITNLTVAGYMGRSRYTSEYTVISGNGALFLAAVMAGAWCFLDWKEKRNR